MADQEQLEILNAGVATWNGWIEDHQNARIELKRTDFSGADLNGARLEEIDFSNANLRGVHLNHADLSGANLSDADLNEPISQGLISVMPTSQGPTSVGHNSVRHASGEHFF